MAATSKQVSSSVYYLAKYGPAKAVITATVSRTEDSQEDLYQLEGEGSKLFAESQVFEAKNDLITYVTTLINALP